MVSARCAGNDWAKTPWRAPSTSSTTVLAPPLKLLLYDGQGFWLMMKRLSQGRFHWWPKTPDAQVSLSARELMILIWNGDPERAQMAQDWRRVA